MKTNPNDLATGVGYTEIYPQQYGLIGLTKRELFSAMAMQGLCASSVDAWPAGETLAIKALKCADALIAELNKEVKDV